MVPNLAKLVIFMKVKKHREKNVKKKVNCVTFFMNRVEQPLRIFSEKNGFVYKHVHHRPTNHLSVEAAILSYGSAKYYVTLFG